MSVYERHLLYDRLILAHKGCKYLKFESIFASTLDFLLTLFCMQGEHYKKTIEQAVYALHEAETEIFTAMVNVGFAGVYEDISKVYDHGESINLELAMFENTSDTNLDLMVDLINQLVSVKNSLMNLNNLDLDLDREEEDLDEEGDG